ncbi:MAG: macrolide ABC transporter ATP-binding protein [Actinobacteria bacterium]|nr:MAG: macrolide ABC transporter ATP-binding protein [Actinomycetota bacterium]
MSGPKEALRLSGVGHVHGLGASRVVALKDISFHVNPGELVAVMGPSGSGKSTLLNIAGGIQRPLEGTVMIDGVDVTRLDAVGRASIRRRLVGYVFQEFNLLPTLSAVENVSLPLELDGMSVRKAHVLALDALEKVGVADLANRFPDDMSGGEAQRVAIARALVGERSVLLADEPTGALDSVTADQVMLILRERVDAGAAGVLVTHDARFAAWADHTLFLRDGRMVDRTRTDSAEDLFLT